MRIGEVLLWIPTDLCSGTNQQYCGTDPPGGMRLDLRPFPMAYRVYLRHLGRRIRGAVVIVECAYED